MPQMSVDEFLNHSGSRGGNRKKYLKKWPASESHSVTVWLHTQASILALWRHQFPTVEVRENKDTKEQTREVWTSRLVCFETEETLRNNFRDRSTGERDAPYHSCPICLMIEHVRQQVKGGAIDWLTPLFRFNASDPRKSLTLHAGGLYNAFGRKDLTDDDRKRMAAVPIEKGGPIYAKESWKQNTQARLEYCFTVVDDADAEAGIQLAIESNLLGDKVKSVIAHAVKEAGAGGDPSEGNPILHPYAIRWEYDPRDGVEFNKKYDAMRMGKLKLRPAVEKLIRETAPPDVSQLAERFNLATWRANLERYYCGPPGALPFDQFFKVAFAEEAARKEAAAAQPHVPEVGTRVPVAPQLPKKAAPPPDEELVACDKCAKPMLLSADKCPHCGEVYNVVAAPPPPAPKLPSRNAALAERAAAQVGLPSVAEQEAEARYAGDPSDDIPF